MKNLASYRPPMLIVRSDPTTGILLYLSRSNENNKSINSTYEEYINKKLIDSKTYILGTNTPTQIFDTKTN